MLLACVPQRKDRDLSISIHRTVGYLRPRNDPYLVGLPLALGGHIPHSILFSQRRGRASLDTSVSHLASREALGWRCTSVVSQPCHLVLHVDVRPSNTNSEMKTEPNKALELSRLLVTPAAFAAAAPSNRLAQLAR